VRQKLGGASLSYFIVKQLPAFLPQHYRQPCPWDRSQTIADWIKPRVLELVYTAHDLKPFAEDLGEKGDPFPWDDKRRAVIRAELDAAFFHLYGISEADADYILETFPIVKSKDEERFGTYRTKEMILDCYRRMAAGDFESELEIAPGKRVPTDLFGDPIQRSRREQLIQVFAETRSDNDGVWSSELVVCHDDKRKRFTAEVARQMPRVGEEDACLELWNARRSGQLTGLPPSTPYPLPKTLRQFDYRVEMASRYVIDQLVKKGYERKSTTPERILCTPALRKLFDDAVTKAMEDLPADIREQFAVHDYRMAAMSIRKRTGGKASDQPSLFDERIPLAQAGGKLPKCPGVYLLRSDTERLFTGWTGNLQEQFESMRAAGAGSLIPSWLLDGRAPAKSIAFHPFDTGTPDILLYEFWRANLRYKLPWLNLYEEDLAA
jgi:hypothetical protein